MRLLVCGGRDFNDSRFVYTMLNLLTQDYKRDEVTIIHGGARGADTLAGQWAKLNKTKLEIFPAQWEAYGKRAGFVRNKQMLEEGKPDLVVAFPGGKGTSMMVDIAEKAGVQVIRYG